MTNYSWDIIRHSHKPNKLDIVDVPQFSDEIEEECERGDFKEENRKYL